MTKIHVLDMARKRGMLRTAHTVLNAARTQIQIQAIAHNRG